MHEKLPSILRLNPLHIIEEAYYLKFDFKDQIADEFQYSLEHCDEEDYEDLDEDEDEYDY
jgi:hypothetical protein